MFRSRATKTMLWQEFSNRSIQARPPRSGIMELVLSPSVVSVRKEMRAVATRGMAKAARGGSQNTVQEMASTKSSGTSKLWMWGQLRRWTTTVICPRLLDSDESTSLTASILHDPSTKFEVLSAPSTRPEMPSPSMGWNTSSLDMSDVEASLTCNSCVSKGKHAVKKVECKWDNSRSTFSTLPLTSTVIAEEMTSTPYRSRLLTFTSGNHIFFLAALTGMVTKLAPNFFASSATRSSFHLKVMTKSALNVPFTRSMSSICFA
mmetsp:Transcript_56825/g.144041  ORF Transcript_56825/g.144041 Transcript_56825/m.144041 type:complete len:262 (+) Transcript_56825:326-1111(+)